MLEGLSKILGNAGNVHLPSHGETTHSLQTDSAVAKCIVCGGEDSIRLFDKNGFSLVRCTYDGHTYVSPQPTLEQLTDVYSADYFSGKSEVGYHHNVFQNKDRHLQRSKRRVKKLKRFIDTGKVLDVGCGPGFFLAVASASFKVDGCDISKVAADYAKKEFGLDIWIGNFLDFPQNAASYDIITMFSYLEHTINPRKSLAKARELLAPEAILVIALPNIDGIPRYLKGKEWRGFSIPEHLHFFNKDNLNRLLNDAGFNPINPKYTENNVFRDTNYFYARRL